jgi:hypothetical protein
MTVKTFWMDATVADTQARYFLVDHTGREFAISRQKAAQMTFGPEMPFGWKVERKISTSQVPACPWCGSRPELFEMDCDGWAATGTCGSEQCNQLKICEGCARPGTQNWGSWRGHLCNSCHDVAEEKHLAAIPGEYGLFPYEEYSKYYNFS